MSGDTAVLGAVNDDDTGTNSGAAYVFVRSGTTWTQQDKLLASDGIGNESFGFSVALSGETALVGASKATAPLSQSGAAYVYVRSGSSWTQQDKLIPDDPEGFSGFGLSVGISGDTAVVGKFVDSTFAFAAGSAYVFSRSGTSWAQQDKLTPADRAAQQEFGHSVSISGDTVVVGAPKDDDLGVDAGAAYIFSIETLDPVLYGISDFALDTVDPVTGALQSSVAISVPGDALPLGGFGLTVNPTTNEMYATVKLFFGSGFNRNLARIDPNTGIATIIGSMDQSIVDLAFDDSGVLYALSGDCVSSCGGPNA